MKSCFLLAALLLPAALLFAQVNPPGLNHIRTADLKKDLYYLAGAHFKGRSAGTTDELRAAAWLAEQYRSIGLQPAGDNGTYFQFFNMVRTHLAPASFIKLNNKPLQLWAEASVAQMAEVNINAPLVYLGNALQIDTNTVDVKGKVVALEAHAAGINLNVSLPTWRYSRYIYATYGLPLIRRGAAAIIFVADPTAESGWEDAAQNFMRGTYELEGDANPIQLAKVPVLWLRAGAKNLLASGNNTLQLNLVISKYTYPSVNVVGVVKGTDPKLKAEHVLYSGHTDAHGIRNPINNDSIYYGADDNGSVNVAMLANARAFVKHPPKRSVLFVIHGAEERGLIGSKHFTTHPTVALNSIVAVLNGDMIGRNHADSAAILGFKPPHRNSADLVNMAFSANNQGPRFKLDTAWDAASHIEGWYFRSDHLPYARLGIPSIMYTTLLHPDYHTPQDNAENINYPKLKKMADWMYRTGYKVANAPQRPATDKDFKLER